MTSQPSQPHGTSAGTSTGTQPGTTPGPAVLKPRPTGLAALPKNVFSWGYYKWHEIRRRQALVAGQEPTLLAFTGYGSTSWVRILTRVLLAPAEEFVDGRRVAQVVKDGVRGWRNFVSPPLAFAEIIVEIGGQTHTVRADRNGVVDAVVPAELEPGWRTAMLHVPGGESTEVDLMIISDDVTEAIVCDIDDTVVVTALPRPLLAAWNSFVIDEHARTPTPGMAPLLNRLVANRKAPVFYVSTGAWNVNQTLTRFMTRNMFPLGPLLLTNWGPTEGRLFRSGTQHKLDSLARLSQDFPHIKWKLIGDDGQHDPEIYTTFALQNPEKVEFIAIRQLTPSEAVLAGGRAQETRYATPGIPWAYGTDGATLSLQLENMGFLARRDSKQSFLAWPQTIRDGEMEVVEEIQHDFPSFTQGHRDFTGPSPENDI